MKTLFQNLLCVAAAVLIAYLSSVYVGSLYCSISGQCSPDYPTVGFTPFVGFLLGVAILKLPEENGKVLGNFFSSMFKAVLKVAEFITLFIPVAVCAFTVIPRSRSTGNLSRICSTLCRDEMVPVISSKRSARVDLP